MMAPKETAERLLHHLMRGSRSTHALCNALSLSPEELAVAAGELRLRGYRVEADSRSRLTLAGAGDLISSSEVLAAVKPGALGRPLYTFGTIFSTNREALRLAAEGAPEGAVVTAEEQTGGRGRQGHRWHSPPRLGIWMSLVLRPPFPPARTTGLSLVVSLSVADALRAAAGVEARIKWPNDLLVNDRKISGILSESVVEGSLVQHTVVGVGVNVNQTSADFSPELQKTACSVRTVTGRTIRRADLLIALLQALETRYRLCCAEGFGALRQEYLERSGLLGRPVEVEQNEHRVRGTVVDVTPEGALLLQTDSGPRLIAMEAASLRSNAHVTDH